MSNVIPFGGLTRMDLPTEQILDAAKGWAGEGVIVMGWDKDGKMAFASSMADGAEALWLIEQAKMALLEIGRDSE